MSDKKEPMTPQVAFWCERELRDQMRNFCEEKDITLRSFLETAVRDALVKYADSKQRQKVFKRM